MRLDVQVDTKRLLTVDQGPASSVIEVLDALRITSLDKLVHDCVTTVADCEAKMMHTIAVFLDEFVIGAWVVVKNLMKLDDESLGRHD